MTSSRLPFKKLANIAKIVNEGEPQKCCVGPLTFGRVGLKVFLVVILQLSGPPSPEAESARSCESVLEFEPALEPGFAVVVLEFEKLGGEELELAERALVPPPPPAPARKPVAGVATEIRPRLEVGPGVVAPALRPST